MRVDGRNPTCFLFTSKQMVFNAMVYLKKKKNKLRSIITCQLEKFCQQTHFTTCPYSTSMKNNVQENTAWRVTWVYIGICSRLFPQYTRRVKSKCMLLQVSVWELQDRATFYFQPLSRLTFSPLFPSSDDLLWAFHRCGLLTYANPCIWAIPIGNCRLILHSTDLLQSHYINGKKSSKTD